MADWSSLPGDVLEKVGEKLFVWPRDYVRARAVCVPWRSSLPKKPWKSWSSWPLHESLPSLIFPPPHHNTKKQRRRFLSLSCIGASKGQGQGRDRGCGFLSLFDIAAGKELYPPPLKLLEGEALGNEDVGKDNLIFKGCSHGWTIAVGKSPEIYLINLLLPFKDRLLRLPPITTFQEVLEYQPHRVGKEYKCHTGRFISSERMRATFIKKVVLSSSSPSAPSTIVVAIAGLQDPIDLVLCRLGDHQWIYLNGFFAVDMVFYNNHFFWVYQEGHMGEVKYVSIPDLLTIYSTPGDEHYGLIKRITVLPNDKFPDKAHANVYLVTCPGGDLLYVTSYHIGKTTHFRVFNFSCLKYSSFSSSNQPNEEMEEMEEMESLGDYVLFLGYNDSWCIPSCNFPADFPGPKKNCIYFTGDHSLGCSDMGIFDYENKTISPFPGYKRKPDLPPAIWFMPYPQ